MCIAPLTSVLRQSVALEAGIDANGPKKRPQIPVGGAVYGSLSLWQCDRLPASQT